MKIAFLLTQSLDSPSGLGRYGPLARGLAQLGHKVEIIALHPAFETLQQTRFEDRGVNIHYVAPMHVKKRGSIKSYYPSSKLLGVASRATWMLTKAAMESQADVIHICKPHPMNSLAGLVMGLLKAKKIFLDCDDLEIASNRFNSIWQKRGVAFFELTMPRLVNCITTNTYFMRDRLQAAGIPLKKIFYLPNGVELSRFTLPDPALVERLRRELGLEGKEVVAFIGTVSLPSHPVDLLLKAFSILSQSHPQAVLLVIGGGEDIDTLKIQAQSLGMTKTIHFIGRVDPNDIKLYYKLADTTVDPVYDNDACRGRSPLKLFESWVSGIPIVTANVGDRRQLLGNPPAGVLAQPGDPDSLAESIHFILTHPDERSKIVSLGREKIKMYFWDGLARQLENVYTSRIY